MLPGPRSRCARGHARPCQGWTALTADDRGLWLGARDPGSGQRHRTGHTGSLESLPMAILGAKTFQNYIDGEWVDAASGETFESTSPANGETIGVFPRSSADDVEGAVAAAKRAYEDWRLVPAPKRGEILFRFAHLLSDQKEDLAQLMAHEM